MKLTVCDYCGSRIYVGELARKIESKLFCDVDCVIDFIASTKLLTIVTVLESDCFYEDAYEKGDAE